MKKINKLILSTSLLLGVFIIYTLLIKYVDVRAIGPNASEVGFGWINLKFKELTGNQLVADGFRLTLYNLTDWGTLLCVPVGAIFLVIGINEWIKRKNIFKVDHNILALGIFYVLTGLTYLFFQVVVINYRPVLIRYGDILELESSYPSSHTVLAITVLISAIDGINIYIKNNKVKLGLIIGCIILSLAFIVLRFISGVHWFSDIIGGIIISFTLLSAYMLIKEILNIKLTK